MTRNGNDSEYAAGHASRDAGHVRGYGMGNGARMGAGSQPVPDPYQPSGYAAGQGSGHAGGFGVGQASGQPTPQRQYAARPAPGAGYGGYAQQPSGQQMPYGQAGGQAYAPRYGMGQVPQGQAAYATPATSVPQALPKKRRRVALWVGIIVAILCIVCACLLALSMCQGGSKRAGEAGQLEGKTEAEIQAELDRQVEEGMFNISIASTVQFEDGESEGEFRIENVPGNPYLMQVAIVRDDTGDEIYRTDMIEPNHHIQRDTLDVDLDPGTYECTATFFACDPQTEDVVGQAAAKMLVVVTG